MWGWEFELQIDAGQRPRPNCRRTALPRLIDASRRPEERLVAPKRCVIDAGGQRRLQVPATSRRPPHGHRQSQLARQLTPPANAFQREVVHRRRHRSRTAGIYCRVREGTAALVRVARRHSRIGRLVGARGITGAAGRRSRPFAPIRFPSSTGLREEGPLLRAMASLLTVDTRWRTSCCAPRISGRLLWRKPPGRCGG